MRALWQNFRDALANSATRKFHFFGFAELSSLPRVPLVRTAELSFVLFSFSFGRSWFRPVVPLGRPRALLVLHGSFWSAPGSWVPGSLWLGPWGPCWSGPPGWVPGVTWSGPRLGCPWVSLAAGRGRPGVGVLAGPWVPFFGPFCLGPLSWALAALMLSRCSRPCVSIAACSPWRMHSCVEVLPRNVEVLGSLGP